MSWTKRFLILILAACWLGFFFKGRFLRNVPSTTADPSKYYQKPAEGILELKFNLVEREKLADGSYRLVAKGIYKGELIGLEVRLGAQWEKRHASGREDFPVYLGRVDYRRTGPESDRLVETFNEWCEPRLPVKPMAFQIHFEAVSLEGDPRTLDRFPLRMELVFRDPKGEPYANVYTNIDWRERKLYIQEKVIEYRFPLLRTLRGEVENKDLKGV